MPVCIVEPQQGLVSEPVQQSLKVAEWLLHPGYAFRLARSVDGFESSAISTLLSCISCELTPVPQHLLPCSVVIGSLERINIRAPDLPIMTVLQYLNKATCRPSFIVISNTRKLFTAVQLSLTSTIQLHLLFFLLYIFYHGYNDQEA
jgi:hypothetical protein